MVTHLTDPERVAELAASVGARTIQVHGDMAVTDLRRLRVVAPGVRLIKAVHVTGEDAISRALDYAADADALLLDSRTAAPARRHRADPRLVGERAERRRGRARAGLPRRGIAPENVEEAIMQVRPAGVDVNSGVEDANG